MQVSLRRQVNPAPARMLSAFRWLEVGEVRGSDTARPHRAKKPGSVTSLTRMINDR